MKKYLIVIIILFVLYFIIMGLFSKNVMFSEVIGTVTFDGKPIENAVIEQSYRWAWNDKKIIETIKTDTNGNFKFSKKVSNAGLSYFLPHEPVISQFITVKYNGIDYDAWYYSKHNYDNNGELGRNINLNIELTQTSREHIANPNLKSYYYGISTIK